MERNENIYQIIRSFEHCANITKLQRAQEAVYWDKNHEEKYICPTQEMCSKRISYFEI